MSLLAKTSQWQGALALFERHQCRDGVSCNVAIRDSEELSFVL